MITEKKTLREWKALISIEREGPEKDSYYTAECPVCLKSHPVDVRGSHASAKALAVENIKQHIRDAHKELVLADQNDEEG